MKEERKKNKKGIQELKKIHQKYNSRTRLSVKKSWSPSIILLPPSPLLCRASIPRLQLFALRLSTYSRSTSSSTSSSSLTRVAFRSLLRVPAFRHPPPPSNPPVPHRYLVAPREHTARVRYRAACISRAAQTVVSSFSLLRPPFVLRCVVYASLLLLLILAPQRPLSRSFDSPRR